MRYEYLANVVHHIRIHKILITFLLVIMNSKIKQ